MRYYYRFFLWENGSKSTEYTNYLITPIFYEDRLNEELDTAEVILDSMPISLKTPFPPKTKFRIERYKTENYTDIPKTWDMVVEHDDVEEYASLPEVCCHRISLIEASVIAQGIHVDNIALTYELQDVTTKYKTYSSDTTKIVANIQNGGYNYVIHEKTYEDTHDANMGGFVDTRTAKFRNSYAYLWNEEDVILLNQLNLNLEISQNHNISFRIPRLFCYGSSNGQSLDKQLFQMNVKCNIYRYETQNGNIINNTKTLVLTQEDGPSFINISNDDWFYSDGTTAALRIIDNTIVEEDGLTIRPSVSTNFENIYSTAPSIAKVGNYNSNVNFVTDSLSAAEIENGKGYKYFIEVVANPTNSDGMLDYYEIGFYAMTAFVVSIVMIGNFDPEVKELEDYTNVYVKADFNCLDMSQSTESGYLIMKGNKYSCYELIRKALLTIDTQMFDNDEIGLDNIQYSIIFDPNWENRLKIAKVQETILENKNLWEVFLQIGYYLHAIPYLQFDTDGTDRFMLSFKQLGGTTRKNDSNNKITIYNSQNLSEYFTEYDSYVANIFSPQNEIDEWLVVKTNDESYLVSNNTSVLKTTYGISEILEFDITYDGGNGGEAGTASALEHIFEKSIYQILTADYNISPSMGDSLYYELGGNEINGLTYIPPSVNNDMPMALKRIVGRLFDNVSINSLKFNNLKFHIRYRTQDSMRVSQVRPDIQNFLKNSSYEKYPKHSQYYGQQDKIVDSERFSLNLFGKLVRVGNNIYQCQEQVVNDNDEKESGDLVVINGEPYYVTAVENEFYPDLTLQKVTYSKNYNQLSQIVTIPSEPRFYEVSERSKIRREKMEHDFFVISTISNENNINPRFLNQNTWQDFIKNIIFNKEAVTLPNYAWTSFIADKKREHRGSYGQYVPLEQMFPSSELDRTNPNQVLPKDSSDHSDCIVPLLHFPIKDGIIFEWDMEDNFKAGDAIDTEISDQSEAATTDEAYYALQSVRYCDILGRADLYKFRLFYKDNWSHSQAQSLPKACIEPAEANCQIYVPNDMVIGLDKDCREELSFNYQISLLHRNDDGDGDFITFSNLFGQKTSELYCCLLDSEVSMFNENTNVISANILADQVQYSFVEDYQTKQLKIDFQVPSGVNLKNVKSLVFYEIDENLDKVSYLAKNFKNGISGDSIPAFYVYPVFSN